MRIFEGKRLGSLVRAASVAAAVAGSPGIAFSQAGGPEYFRIIDLKTDDNVNVRSEPNASAKVVGKIPKGADGVKNLGCKGGLTAKQWEKANDARKKADTRTGWCEVQFNDVKGWISRRLLVEGAAPKQETLEQQAQTPEEMKQKPEQKPASPPPPPEKISPSFDCEKAQKNAEKLICADYGLAALDREVARLYGLVSEELNATPGFEALLDGQRKWISERNTCFDQECLSEMYVRRVHQLRQGFPAARKPGNGSKSAGPYVLRCDTLDALVGVTVVTTNPAYAYLEWRDSFVVMKKTQGGPGVHYEGGFAALHARGTKASLKLPGGSSELTCKLETGG